MLCYVAATLVVLIFFWAFGSCDLEDFSSTSGSMKSLEGQFSFFILLLGRLETYLGKFGSFLG